MAHSVNRRHLQFSLAGALLVVTALAVWLVSEANTVHRRAATLRQFQENGATVIDQPFGGNWGHARFGDPDKEPSYLRELMGDRSVFSIVFQEAPTPAEILATELFPEADVVYRTTPVGR
ncbi:MAG TPA: hypothetical protein VGN12_21375 [Pirellulales bacterium]|jgi:hypothetical protein